MRAVFLTLVTVATLGALALGPAWLASHVDDPWDFTLACGSTDEDDPFAQARMRERLVALARLVEEEVGDPIDLAGVRLTTAEAREVGQRGTLEAYPAWFDAGSDTYDVLAQMVVGAGVEVLTSSHLGAYTPETRTISIYPLTFQMLAPDGHAALLDVVLAHELVHVWQHQQGIPLDEHHMASTSEVELARAAVVEGSAEYISRAVACRLGVLDSWERIAGAREDDGDAPSGNALQQMQIRWQRWAYGEGLRFVEQVVARMGGAFAWRRLHGAMPTTVWEIEHPDAWLDGHGAGVPDLGPWAERMIAHLRQQPPRFAWRDPWGHRPLLAAEVDARLAHAGLDLDDAPWDACRGGMLVAGTPVAGPLAEAAVVLRAYRFPTPELAEAAAGQLARDVERFGATSYTGVETTPLEGCARRRVDAEGGVAFSTLYVEGDSGPAQAGCWAVRRHEGLVFEVFCFRDGIDVLLLDTLRAAVASLDPGWDGRVPSVSPEAAAAYRALAPRTEDEADDGVERSAELTAALRHADESARRYALEGLATGRLKPAPSAGEALAELRRLTRHEDPWIRSLAVRIAWRLRPEKLLSRAERRALDEDPSPAVRRANTKPPKGGRGFADMLVDAVMSRTERDRRGDRRTKPDLSVPRTQEEMASLTWEVMLTDRSGDDWPDLERRLRRVLRRAPVEVRAGALAVLSQGEKRLHFAPAFVRAIAVPALRPIAELALGRGGFDLGPGGAMLEGLLDDPACRVLALRALAANDVGVADETIARARAWMQADDDRLRTAAALLVLGADPDDTQALPLLVQSWDRRHADWRLQIVDAAVRHRSEDPRTEELQRRAVASRVASVRHGFLERRAKAPYDAAHVARVLAAMGELGAPVAYELWSHLLSHADHVSGEEQRALADQVGAAIARWCDRGRLPRIRPTLNKSYPSQLDLGASAAWVAALDRALLLEDPSLLRAHAAVLRNAVDGDVHPPAADVQAAIDRMLSLGDLPEAAGEHYDHELVEALEERPSAGPEAMRNIIRARLAGRLSYFGYVSMGDLLDERPDRIAAAVEFVPELLEHDREGSIELAIEILEAAGSSAAHHQPLLERFMQGAIPSVRREIEEAIEGLQPADAAADPDGD